VETSLQHSYFKKIRRVSSQVVNSHYLNIVARRLLLLGLDGVLIILAFYGAIALRLNNPDDIGIFLTKQMALLPAAVLSGVGILWLSGWYRGLTRYTGSYSLYGLVPRSFLMVLSLLFISTRFYQISPPRSYWILYWLLFTGGAITMRIVLRDILLNQTDSKVLRVLKNDSNLINPTLIYGAGSSGLTLLMGLRTDSRFKIIGFLDDDPALHGRTLQNQVIYSPDRLPNLVQKFSINKVLLAMPSIPRQRKRYLVDNLTHNGVSVLSIPSVLQLASGSRTVSDLKNVAIEDLLGREPSTPVHGLLESSVDSKVVLVTGAGGSIGSELCRQIAKLGVAHLIILELNEYVLYCVSKELRKENPNLRLTCLLGNVADTSFLVGNCKRWKVNTIYHAAAYKHVPLVEENVCAGVSNNIRGALSVIQAAKQSQIERVMLVSTDKAVRPTNVMGASKRICELLFQSAAEESSTSGPVFSMVRFGNVLGSSGSVIPLFHEQIERGGPVTVTHPAVTRYFMTIPEAVQLVLQSTGMAVGGDVFLLDMGEPVRIADLARQMIELSGLRVRDDKTPDGDISIEFSGLRPGEKLFEELLISAHDEATEHPLIRRAKEPRKEKKNLDFLVQELLIALDSWNEIKTIKVMQELVPEFKNDLNL
jgi:FlaA1/EpsC-like NDP-sugar epimerase